VKTSTKMMVGSSISLSLLLVAVSVKSAAHFARAHETASVHAQREYSDLQKDELSLTKDMKLLRRDLRRGTSAVAITKDQNFVRQDLLNIILDRWQPAEESQDLERDQDLASVIGELSAGVTQEVIHNLAPANHG
jgi:hypothetical protein